MKPHWILIANASQARLLQQEPDCPLVVLQSFQHPASRTRSSVLGDDERGREASDRAFGGAAYEPRIDEQKKEHLHFARELADVLEQGVRDARYASVTVYASSPFLGELKQALHDGTRRLLSASHDVDLTALGLTEIEQRLQARTH
jgi:protein required for attachment to host cells